MKAIGIKMVELVPMRASMATQYGYKIGNANTDDMGYEVTYSDGYKSWTPKKVADVVYFPLSPENDGTKILKEDVEKFITDADVATISDKIIVIDAHTLTGFDVAKHYSCNDPKNYSKERNIQYIMDEIVNDIWEHLGFVLQWAKNGLKGHKQEEK